MERKRLTCPETAVVAEVELEWTELGTVIGACSRFQARSELACTRECARQMDRQNHVDTESQERVLILVAGRQPPVSRAPLPR
jgi:hypothetical protein